MSTSTLFIQAQEPLPQQDATAIKTILNTALFSWKILSYEAQVLQQTESTLPEQGLHTWTIHVDNSSSIQKTHALVQEILRTTSSPLTIW